MTTFDIYTDGAATMRKIDGEYVREAGGWGYVILQNGEEIMSDYGGLSQTTNNAMELTAILNALRKYLSFGYNGQEVRIYSDSAYCIGIFTQWINGWKVNDWTRGKKHEPIENVGIIKEIDNVLEQIERRFCTINWVKVKGHNGNEWNEYVDKLAVKGKLECAAGGNTNE